MKDALQYEQEAKDLSGKAKDLEATCIALGDFGADILGEARIYQNAAMIAITLLRTWKAYNHACSVKTKTALTAAYTEWKAVLDNDIRGKVDWCVSAVHPSTFFHLNAAFQDTLRRPPQKMPRSS